MNPTRRPKTHADPRRTAVARPADPGDEALLDLVQRQTFRYFWDFAHPTSGLARERSNVTPDYGRETVATGGSGFGIMSIVVAVERQWIARADAVDRLLQMSRFLYKADSYHGVLPHFLNGETGRTIPFSRKDDGADLVETSYLVAGLLCARQYFDRDDAGERDLRARIDALWQEVEWEWHTRGESVLYWHWSPNNGWAMNHQVRGWNECLITYVLAASAPRHRIDPDVYLRGWAQSRTFTNGREFYGIRLPLGPDYGGPLFFAHYSFLGLDPRGLRDRYADYWQQNVAHALINYEHCVRNPHGFKGYGADCWGLTASDDHQGYAAHAPDHDLGVISPTAALSSFPYTPAHSIRALRHFYHQLGDRIWGEYGFVDAFSETHEWYASSYLAIDQGPIVVMIENYRSGLLWRLFMSCPEVRAGLRRLGFESPHLEQEPAMPRSTRLADSGGP
jgi:hypothetical protein